MIGRITLASGIVAFSGIGVMATGFLVNNEKLPTPPNSVEANKCRAERLIGDQNVNDWYSVAINAPRFSGFGEAVPKDEKRPVKAINGQTVMVSINDIEACASIYQEETQFISHAISAQTDRVLNRIFAGFGVTIVGLAGLGIGSNRDTKREIQSYIEPVTI